MLFRSKSLISIPSNSIAPSASSIPNKALAREDFPEPDSPTKPRVSPGKTSKETSSTAFT